MKWKSLSLVGFRSREFPLVDPVGIGDDLRAFGLPEDFGQPGDADQLRGDQIREHRSGADAGKLVDIAHEKDPRIGSGSP